MTHVDHRPRGGGSAGRPSAPQDLPPSARRILRAAQDILAERGCAELTMTAISQVTGLNRALVSYSFGGKAGPLRALAETLFHDSEVGLVADVASCGRELPRASGRVTRATRTRGWSRYPGRLTARSQPAIQFCVTVDQRPRGALPAVPGGGDP